MKLLAIDAATEACSVALHSDGEIFERHRIAPRGHAQYLLGMVDELLAEAGYRLAQLDAIAFDRGPGSFTGVRIGTSVTLGLAFGAGLPVIPVSSLAIIAQGAWRQYQASQVLAAIDARMNEVYWATYHCHDGIMQLQGEEHVSSAERLDVTTPGPWFGAGSGWQAYADTLSTHLGNRLVDQDGEFLPYARDLITLAIPLAQNRQWLAPEQALPTYLRNEVAEKPST